MNTPVGKDAPLAQTISTLRNLLSTQGLEIDELAWFNPVVNVWSVQIRERHCPLLQATGKGSSQQTALASALGEFFERLSCNYFFADYYLGADTAGRPFSRYPEEREFPVTDNHLPAELLDGPSRLHYSINGELQPQPLLNGHEAATPSICALPFTRQKNGQTVWFPLNLINSLYGSNGIAAGNSRWEARVQALSEIFERHIKSTILSSGITLPRIPQPVIDEYPTSAQTIQALRDQGYVIVANDASLGGKFPLVNITLMNPADGGCFAAFGAHPKFEVALERALTELLQGRNLDTLTRMPAPSFDIGAVADPLNLKTHFADSSGIVAWDLFSNAPDYNFTRWNVEGDTRAEFDHLCHLIHRVDMDIYIADYAHLGYDSCRIIVPGMSEIYPLDRLTERDRGNSIRESILQLANLSPRACLLLQEQLEEAGFDEQTRVAELIGIAADSGSAFETLRVGELKGLLALTLNDLEAARDWSDWTLHYGQLHPVRETLYRCLTQCLNFALDEQRPLEQYLPILTELHGESCVNRCLAMLDGEAVFADFPTDDGSLQQFGTHSSLIRAWQRLQQHRHMATASGQA